MDSLYVAQLTITLHNVTIEQSVDKLSLPFNLHSVFFDLLKSLLIRNELSTDLFRGITFRELVKSD